MAETDSVGKWAVILCGLVTSVVLNTKEMSVRIKGRLGDILPKRPPAKLQDAQ